MDENLKTITEESGSETSELSGFIDEQLKEQHKAAHEKNADEVIENQVNREVFADTPSKALLFDALNILDEVDTSFENWDLYLAARMETLEAYIHVAPEMAIEMLKNSRPEFAIEGWSKLGLILENNSFLEHARERALFEAKEESGGFARRLAFRKKYEVDGLIKVAYFGHDEASMQMVLDRIADDFEERLDAEDQSYLDEMLLLADLGYLPAIVALKRNCIDEQYTAFKGDEIFNRKVATVINAEHKIAEGEIMLIDSGEKTKEELIEDNKWWGLVSSYQAGVLECLKEPQNLVQKPKGVVQVALEKYWPDKVALEGYMSTLPEHPQELIETLNTIIQKNSKDSPQIQAKTFAIFRKIKNRAIELKDEILI